MEEAVTLVIALSHFAVDFRLLTKFSTLFIDEIAIKQQPKAAAD